MLRELQFAALLALLGLGATRPAAATEEPDYRVLERDGSFELREYPAMLAAETLVTGADFEEAGDIAFGRLFRYITGNNRAQAEIAMTAPVVQTAERTPADGEKIAMTAPVIQQPGASGGYRVAFIVPAQYTRETVPEPLDPAVRIVTTPARLVAAMTYSGRASESLHRKKEESLRSELAQRNLTASGEPIAAQYDAPFIPGPFRRNEVLIPVTGPPPGPAVR
ncbi:MAG: heme-binding protein [Gammaproteobacteria bacterium]|nr:heme-binding protein [Gammaproteobacteria bacterium]